jgi:diaminohydroxyphosphoribosylaminopyrimidine deaminase/5-amino-6-(5-phosphoribosylamino)uracil reductase
MNALAPETWRRLLRRSPADAALSSLYGPLLAPPIADDGCYVLGRIAQSLDGRIATTSGASHWISGHDDIVHTHRLRALFDAVVVGAGTVRADDPQLTTREVEGPSPVRVVLDTDRRLDANYRVFRDAPATLLFCAADAPSGDLVGKAPVLRLPRARAGLDIDAVLHVTIAPLLIGSGIPAFTLPEAASLTEGLRLDWSVHHVGADLLLDIPLGRVRPGARP